eukprot:TRINITY_DN26815_c0_g1_i1.p1 TRINITY_DN26815_c0_g1~~TRINITY_DN26815_c0_g1_i1.p1  ORF type:complete len:206 (+),score=54.29 TRINITY_DN26815_c0_g1_i1:171-788(+)
MCIRDRWYQRRVRGQHCGFRMRPEVDVSLSDQGKLGGGGGRKAVVLVLLVFFVSILIAVVNHAHEVHHTRAREFAQNRGLTTHRQSLTKITTDNLVELTQQYFRAWNAHDQNQIMDLHANQSTLQDWTVRLGPTNHEVARGIGALWANSPRIQIRVLDIYVLKPTLTCVASIEVVVDEETRLKVSDLIQYNDDGKIVGLNAYLAS